MLTESILTLTCCYCINKIKTPGKRVLIVALVFIFYQRLLSFL